MANSTTGTSISDCMFHGLINAPNDNFSGIVGICNSGYGNKIFIKNCAVYEVNGSTFETNGSYPFSKGDQPNITNCYYSKDGNVAEFSAKQGTYVQYYDFLLGKTCYENLNGSVSDGSQTWYQEIGGMPAPNSNLPTVYGGDDDCPNGNSYTNKTHNLTVTKDEETGTITYTCTNAGCTYTKSNVTKPAYDTATNTYQLWTQDNLVWFAENVNNGNCSNANAILMADLEMPSDKIIANNKSHAYTGTFDGNHHSIKVNYNSNSWVSTLEGYALFGFTNGAKIKHLNTEGSIYDIYHVHNHDGGIVSYAQNTMIEGCSSSINAVHHTYDTGETAADHCIHNVECLELGGIVGYADKNCKISNCSFTGSFKIYTSESWAFIVGYADGAAISNCFACTKFNSIVNTDAFTKRKQYTIAGGSPVITNCYYNNYMGEVQGTKKDDADFKSGNLCHYLNNGVTDGTQAWYQTLGSDDYPVADNSHGTVYVNTAACPSTLFYSNKTHTLTGEKTGSDGYYHTACIENGCNGYYEFDKPTYNSSIDTYYIKNKGNLCWFGQWANFNHGKANATLMNNIDLTDVAWKPIGWSVDDAFRGTFDGQGHRIKNLNATSTSSHLGLFGTLGNGATIRNTIIDSSCQFETSTNVTGVAGIAGCVESTSGSTCVAYIQNCGNEAIINGGENAAGILGGVYTNQNAMVFIQNCYNIGNIKGSKNSATICGYAKHNYSITNCYNTGSITGGNTTNGIFYTHDSEGSHYVDNCYDINGKYGSTVYKISTDQVSSGELCNALNNPVTGSEANVFSQVVGTDNHPLPGTGGLSGITISHITDAQGLTDFATSFKNDNNTGFAIVYLDNDIDFSQLSALGSQPSFTPIGSESKVFKGTFDGQGHHIKNLSVTGSVGVGLIGCAAGLKTIVRNVVIDKTCSVKGSTYGVAGVVGCVESTSGSTCNVTIENCGNEADITGVENVAGLLGGIYNNNSTVVNINNCYNTGAVYGESDKSCASIVGYARVHTNIRNTWNSGTVERGVRYNYSFAGTWEGVKQNNNRGTFDGTIENCYTTISSDQTPNVNHTLTDDQLRTGKFSQILDDNCSSHIGWTNWAQNLENDTHPIFGDAGIYYTRTMANQWGTICLPYAIENGDDYDLYSITNVTNDVLTLTKVTGTLAAGTPALIRRNTDAAGIDVSANGTTIVTTPVAGSAANGLTLTGAFSSTDITDKDGYIIANNSFWNIANIKGENKVSCAPFHAYLAGSISSGAKQLIIGVSNETPTAVETINAITTGTAEYYDLNGRRINDLQKGINIVKFSDGITKKVIIK